MIRQRQVMVTPVSQDGLGRWYRTSLTRKSLFRSARRVISSQATVRSDSGVAPVSRRKITKAISTDCPLRMMLILSQGAQKACHRGRPSPYTTKSPTIPSGFSEMHMASLPYTPSLRLLVFDRYLFHLFHFSRPLRLISPQRMSDTMTAFIFQFRSLVGPGPETPCKPQKSWTLLRPSRWVAPLGGTLRIVGTNPWSPNPLETLLCLPSGPRFRSL